jgi:hypothetical protein
MEEGVYGLIDHFLLIRHGRVVADHHFEHDYVTIASAYDPTNQQYNYDHPEWHPYYRDTDLHTLQSVTKSVTSVALGIAWNEMISYDDASNTCIQMEASEAWIEFVLSQGMREDPVAVFNGWNIHGGAQRSYWRVLQERIIPAVR